MNGITHLRAMTVADIRETAADDYVEVMFLESARFYKLFRENPAFGDTITCLRASLAEGRAVNVWTESLDSNVLKGARVRPP
jgi:hypothetical protein